MPHAIPDPPSPVQNAAAMAGDASPDTMEAAPTPTANGASDEAAPVKIEQASSPPWVAAEGGDVEMTEDGAALVEDMPVEDVPVEDVPIEDVPADESADVPVDDAPAKTEAVVKAEVAPSEAVPMEAIPTNLEELFADDDDDDDEFSSSNRAEEAAAPKFDVLSLQASDPEVMRSFYQRLFPWRYLFQWLNHSPTPTNDFAHREFAFTLQNDAYLRYQAFPTSDL